MSQETHPSIPNHLIGPAKQVVSRWFDQNAQIPTSIRPKLLAGVEMIARELPARSNWLEIRTVALDDGKDLLIREEKARLRIYPCQSCLAVTTAAPNWARGWSTVLKNEEVYDVLTWFLHYARQYVHRAGVVNAMMAAWERHNKVLGPFGVGALYQNYGVSGGNYRLEDALTIAERDASERWGSIDFTHTTGSRWSNINFLDPNLQQAAFHFLRGQSLATASFELEAVVALDCSIQSIAAFLNARNRSAQNSTRGEICGLLGLSDDHAAIADYAYFVRNEVGAHPGGWRWWDHGELLDEDQFAAISEMAYKALEATAGLEITERSIDPVPKDWGLWLFEHFPLLWGAVSFK